jgi:hypothetical protein
MKKMKRNMQVAKDKTYSIKYCVYITKTKQYTKGGTIIKTGVITVPRKSFKE